MAMEMDTCSERDRGRVEGVERGVGGGGGEGNSDRHTDRSQPATERCWRH